MVWADGRQASFESTRINQFLIQAGGGVGINTNTPVAGGLSVNGNTVIGGFGARHRLGIGTDNPWNALHVIGPKDQDPFRVMVENNDQDSAVIRGYRNHGIAIGYSYSSVPDNGLRVRGDAIKTGGGSWSAPSDRRLKTNIEPLADGVLTTLLQLRGHTFEFTEAAIERGIAEAGIQTGFIAQEVAEVFPDWVGGSEDDFYYVTERGTTALLVEALRELDQRNEELEAKNSSLGAEVGALSERLAKIEALLSEK